MLSAPSPEPPGFFSLSALQPWQVVFLLKFSFSTHLAGPLLCPLARIGARAPMGAAPHWQVVQKEALATGAGTAVVIKSCW